MARNPYTLDFAPINNALAAWQKQRNTDREFDESGRRWEAQNALAQGQFGLQRSAAARQQAEYDRQNAIRGEVTNWLASNPNVGGVPQPLVDLSRIQGDASPVQQYLLAEAKRRAALSGPEEFGKAGAVYQDPITGEFKAIQFGGRGTLKTHDLRGMRPAKGTTTVGDEIVDSATGQPVRNVAPNIAAGERAKVEGRERGGLITKIPAAQAAFDTMKAKDKVALDVIDRTLPDLSGWTTGLVGSAAAKIPGTKAHDIANRLNTIKAQTGFAELQAMRDASPTGGALGQVSEMENRLLQSVWAAIEQSQSGAELRNNFDVLKEVIAGRQQRMAAHLERLTRMQGEQPQAGQAPPAGMQGGAGQTVRRKFNPQTGEIE